MAENSDLIARILLVVLGALFGGVLNAGVRLYIAFKESQGVAAAIRSEIEGVLSVVQFRQYLTDLDAIIGRLEQVTYVPTFQDVYAVPVTQNFFAVFDALSGKLGALGSLNGRVVRVYILGKGVLEDFALLNTLRNDLLRLRVLPERAELLRITQNLRTLLGAAVAEGLQAVNELAAYEQRWWFGVLWARFCAWCCSWRGTPASKHPGQPAEVPR